EDEPHEPPGDRADEEVEDEARRRRGVDLVARDRRRGDADERHRQRRHDPVDDPDDLPEPIALHERDLALDEGVGEAGLGRELRDHVPASPFSSASSILRPVIVMKTSSSEPRAPYRPMSSLVVPSATSRPPCSTPM